MPAEGRSLDSRAVCKGAKGMTTDGNLTGSDKVQRLQHILHAKAKENPKLRVSRWRIFFVSTGKILTLKFRNFLPQLPIPAVLATSNAEWLHEWC